MANSRANRPKRVPIGTRNILTYPKIPGYVTRVVNDTEDRIERFKQAGYEPVESHELLGDQMVREATQVGSIVSKSVGLGTKGVLMKIKQEWYDEDQTTKQERVDKSEEMLIRQAKEAGLTDQLKNEKLPGIKITRGTVSGD